MNKRLVPFEGGMAVVLDIPLLAIIGAEGATQLDLTTDGQRLILSPVRQSQGEERTSTPAAHVGGAAPSFNADKPKDSARVIEVLQAQHGFTQEHFRQLHHAGPKASLRAHINYCLGTGRFITETNPIVGRRLILCLRLREKGSTWEKAIAQAQRDYPFPVGVET